MIHTPPTTVSVACRSLRQYHPNPPCLPARFPALYRVFACLLLFIHFFLNYMYDESFLLSE